MTSERNDRTGCGVQTRDAKKPCNDPRGARRDGEIVPLCRALSQDSRGGASTVPRALTMTAADLTMVAAERAQARNRATVSRAHSR